MCMCVSVCMTLYIIMEGSIVTRMNVKASIYNNIIRLNLNNYYECVLTYVSECMVANVFGGRGIIEFVIFSSLSTQLIHATSITNTMLQLCRLLGHINLTWVISVALTCSHM